ncbi:MAG: twin-arginine translocase TatA/TatE family subunit [Muribaculaceae bacterium]|jgi:sec-independent protein translocase protein TatA|nr:twin-arginine translocase TatA/TatE family subunit [Muribaculaceae bacterium]
MTLNWVLLLFGTLGTSELLLIAFVVLLLFGGKKIPELMKGLGKGVRSFKKGMNDVEEEIKKPLEDDEPSKETKE